MAMKSALSKLMYENKRKIVNSIHVMCMVRTCLSDWLFRNMSQESSCFFAKFWIWPHRCRICLEVRLPASCVTLSDRFTKLTEAWVVKLDEVDCDAGFDKVFCRVPPVIWVLSIKYRESETIMLFARKSPQTKNTTLSTFNWSTTWNSCCDNH